MDLTLPEAWVLWWSDRQLTDYTLYGVPVLWLGRFGKLLSFFSGCVIVLDVIGPRRLRDWGLRLRKAAEERKDDDAYASALLIAPQVFLLVVGLAALMIATDGGSRPGGQVSGQVFLLFALGFAVLSVGGALLVSWGIPRLLTHPRRENAIRIAAIALFLLGFGLDFLAS